MTYQRTLPRDLFNEAKLLKCLGQLSLLICNEQIPLKELHDDETFPGFWVDQDVNDGSFLCTNLHYFRKRAGKLVAVEVRSALNARMPYPLFFTADDGEEHFVFHDDGSITDEFRKHIQET